MVPRSGAATIMGRFYMEEAAQTIRSLALPSWQNYITTYISIIPDLPGFFNWPDIHFISFTAQISERTFPSNLPNLMFTFYSNFLIWFALLAWLRGWVVGLKWQNFTKKVVLCPFFLNRTNMVTLSSMPRAEMSLKMLSWLSSYRFEL